MMKMIYLPNCWMVVLTLMSRPYHFRSIEIDNFSTTFKREADSAYIRRSIKLMCLKIGFSSNSIESIMLMLTEVLTNVSKHANGFAKVSAEVIYENYRYEGLLVRIRDFGFGIENIDLSIQDGYSTAGSLGLGLGAIRRLSDTFHIESYPISRYKDNSGTLVEFTKLLKSPKNYNNNDLRYNNTEIKSYFNTSLYMPQNIHNIQKKFKWSVDGKTDKKSGTFFNGDAIYWHDNGLNLLVGIFDGIGHGHAASMSSEKAIEVMKKEKNKPINLIMDNIDKELQNTIGCQGLVLMIDKQNNELSYIGVGNIRGYIMFRGKIKTLLSKDGIIGRIYPNIALEKIPISDKSTIILHSDGISRAWLSDIKSRLKNHLDDANVVIELFRKYKKSNDDYSYVVIKNY
jgi:anti-sigma regulatory factor (Ser/Thr protein kinase)/serine/threonine protein phosphatase PrpC